MVPGWRNIFILYYYLTKIIYCVIILTRTSHVLYCSEPNGMYKIDIQNLGGHNDTSGSQSFPSWDGSQEGTRWTWFSGFHYTRQRVVLVSSNLTYPRGSQNERWGGGDHRTICKYFTDWNVFKPHIYFNFTAFLILRLTIGFNINFK